MCSGGENLVLGTLKDGEQYNICGFPRSGAKLPGYPSEDGKSCATGQIPPNSPFFHFYLPHNNVFQDWRQENSSLKHLSFTCGQKFPTELIRDFESLSYRTITPGNYNALCQQIPSLSMVIIRRENKELLFQHHCHFGEWKLQFLYQSRSSQTFALVVIDERKTLTFHCL